MTVCKFLLQTEVYEPTDDGRSEMQTGYDYECGYAAGDMDFDPKKDCPYIDDNNIRCPLKEEALKP